MLALLGPAHYAVVAALHGKRFSLEDEKRTQAEIAAVLTVSGLDFRREVALAPANGLRGVIDFAIPGEDGKLVGLEIKLGGSAVAIHRQMCRYAHDDQVASLVLATSKAIAFPPVVGGKRCTVINLWAAWL